MSAGLAIGEFIAVGQLAFRLYRDCFMVAKGAPQEFQVLKGELSNLNNTLKILEEEVKNPESILVEAGEDRVRMVKEMVSGINVTLKKLEKVAAQYGILGDGSKGKKIWMKIKWSANLSSVDSLRNKLAYHNGMMILLLTSIGNSSLERIETSTRALEIDVGEIKDFIRAQSESENQGNQSSISPLVSVETDDEIFKISLTTALMKNAEVLQPWNTIGADQWIQAGRWWLLKSQMELYAAPVSSRTVPLQAYTNLVKAFWILIDIIACHPQRPFFSSSTHHEVQLLSAQLKREFKRINELQLALPDLCELMDQNLQIWEIQAKGPLLLPGNKSPKSDLSLMYGDLWTVEGEQMYFQRFALYQRREQSLPCMILFLVYGMTARIVAQDQNRTTLMEIALNPQVDTRAEGCSLVIDKETITFSTSNDVEHLCSIFEAAKLYFCPSRDNVNLDDFQGFILIAAVKNKCRDAVMRLLENSTSKADSSNDNCLGSALTVASTLASQFIKLESNGGLHDFSERSKGRISLFSWAAQCGHVTVVRELIEKGANGVAKLMEVRVALFEAASHGHEAVVGLLLENGADVKAKTTSGRTVLYMAASHGHQAVTKLLLEKGADVEAETFTRETAMHGAAKHGYEAVVKLLLDKGADIETKDENGSTALDMAADNEHETVVKLLKSAIQS